MLNVECSVLRWCECGGRWTTKMHTKQKIVINQWWRENEQFTEYPDYIMLFRYTSHICAHFIMVCNIPCTHILEIKIEVNVSLYFGSTHIFVLHIIFMQSLNRVGNTFNTESKYYTITVCVCVLYRNFFLLFRFLINSNSGTVLNNFISHQINIHT